MFPKSGSQQRILSPCPRWFHRGLLLILLSGLSALGQILGDLNGDGSVTICDLAMLRDHLLSNPSNGLPRLTTNNLALPLADMDTNGVITSADFQRLLDTIVGRLPVQEFNTDLLSYDDGDGFTYLEDWHFGTNPFLRDTDGDGIEDEIDYSRPGGVIVAQPPVDILRMSDEAGLRGIVVGQPPVEVLRLSTDGGSGVVVGQPPIQVLRLSADEGLGVVVGQPPVQVLRASPDEGLGVVVGQPPVAVRRP